MPHQPKHKSKSKYPCPKNSTKSQKPQLGFGLELTLKSQDYSGRAIIRADAAEAALLFWDFNFHQFGRSLSFSAIHGPLYRSAQTDFVLRRLCQTTILLEESLLLTKVYLVVRQNVFWLLQSSVTTISFSPNTISPGSSP